MRPQLVALIVAASLTTGWLLASVVSPPVATLQDLPRRDQPRGERAADPEIAYAEQLRFRLQAAPPRPQPRRNPFVFADRTRVAEKAREAPPPVLHDALPPADTVFPLRLSGIGTRQEDGGFVRTAVVSDGATVHLVEAGESIAGYTVVEVTEDRVVLADAAGQQRVLRLP